MIHGIRLVAMRNLISIVAILALAALAMPSTALATNLPPVISSFSPAKGPVGTLVTIAGKHFDAAGLQVSFGGTAGTPETATATKIQIRVPPLAPTGKIQVRTRYGTATSSSNFGLTRGIASFPKGAWPGQSITIAGSGFTPGHDLTLKLDGSSLGGVGTDAHGNFSAIRTLPSDLTLGPQHILAALDTITHVQPKIHLWIFGSWPQARNDPEETGNGTAEFLINPSNVKKVTVVYGIGPANSPAVEDDGHLYLGRFNGVQEIVNYTQPNISVIWGAVLDGPVTVAPAVANQVLYAVTDDTLYAFPEDESTAQPALWTANLGDAAHPFAPVVADGRVYVADGGTGVLQVFDANGLTNCAGSPKVCTPLWFNTFTSVFGPPAVDAKSDGGTGNVYLSVRAGGINKVVVRTGAGGTVGSSAALASTSLSGPSVAGGRALLSGWSAGSSTATLYALDGASQSLLWNSADLGGSSAPTAVAVGGGHTFVQNSDGVLLAFKTGGCGTSTCSPLWQSVPLGQGGGLTPPTLANGVVYVGDDVQPAPYDHEERLLYFDAAGCGSSTCASLYPQNPDLVGTNSQITVVAGTVLTVADGTINIAVLP